MSLFVFLNNTINNNVWLKFVRTQTQRETERDREWSIFPYNSRWHKIFSLRFIYWGWQQHCILEINPVQSVCLRDHLSCSMKKYWCADRKENLVYFLFVITYLSTKIVSLFHAEDTSNTPSLFTITYFMKKTARSYLMFFPHH